MERIHVLPHAAAAEGTAGGGTTSGGGNSPRQRSFKGPSHPQGVISRVQALSASLYILTCTAFVLLNLPLLHRDAAKYTYLYFSPVSAPLLFLWLWAFVVRHFERQHVPYEVPFTANDRKKLLPAIYIFQVAILVTVLLATAVTAFVWCCANRNYTLARFIPPSLYFVLVIGAAMPINVLHRHSREFFCWTVFRVLFPFQEMSWADFLLADILTSLARPMADMERVACSLLTGPVLGGLTHNIPEDSERCSSLSWHFMVAMCLPYTIRFIQCLGVCISTGNINQAFNALKYASAFPALILSNLEHEYHMRGIPFDMRALWLISTAFNSLFSFYWDVEQDWDMPWLVLPGRRLCWKLYIPSPKADSMYSPKWYGWLVVSNFVLRHSWFYRLVGQLETHDLVGWAFALAEVARRWQWVYVRYETELRKLKAKRGHHHGSELDLVAMQDDMT